MTADQAMLGAILLAAGVLFVSGRLRPDLVAMAALLACVATGLVPAGEAFLGFSQPAVITVAAVLVAGRGLVDSGVVEALAAWLLPRRTLPTPLLILVLGAPAAVLSAVMNNVGALMILMPVAVRAARAARLSPSRVLMPLSFATMLGGMTTLIGTPPNLIVSGFRAEAVGVPFGFFAFAPVGVPVALAGLAVLALLGGIVLPDRREAADDGDAFEIAPYLAELRVADDAKAAGRSLREVEETLDRHGGQVLALTRAGRRRAWHGGTATLRAGDIVLVEAEPEALQDAAGLGLLPLEPGDAANEAGRDANGESEEEEEEDVLLEAVATEASALAGSTARTIRLRSRFRVNLVGVASRAARHRSSLRDRVIAPGDVVLLRGSATALQDAVRALALLPLADRGVSLQPRRAMTAGGIFALAIAAAASGLLPSAIAFVAAALAMTLSGIVPARRVYEAVDWPVVVLLGAMLPVASAMEATGAATALAQLGTGALIRLGGGAPLIGLLVAAMQLSDLMNNAATAALMAPLAVQVAAAGGLSVDSCLLAVAIGASCAFLTPIGHQNNLLVMGPGGYRFTDYLRLGIPVQTVVAVVAGMLLLARG